jgi:hypothetical protein
MACLAGATLALFARPGAVDNLELLKIQIFDLARAKAEGIPLAFGIEVYPVPTEVVFQNFGFLAVVWICSLIAIVVVLRNSWVDSGLERSILVSSALLSLVGFQVTMLVAARGLELWLVFGALTVVQTAAVLSSRLKPGPTLGFAAASVAILATVALPAHVKAIDTYGIDPNRLRPAMTWLKNNSEQGDVVGTVYWDLFGDMFLHNRKNYYVEGMDPIFLYSQDPDLFWKLYYLESGQAGEKTSGSPPGYYPIMVDTFNVFRNDLAAKFILIVRGTTPKLEQFMRTDPRFDVGYEDESVVVFELDE